ncbi:MAG: MmgE/PrpD family protein, partial [Granulosicoccus sp.]|nr:MmgE/PrpD family protein [Granulosicoccus sp.]
MTLTTQLVDLIRAKPITDADLQRASFLFLDALATAYAGSRTPVGKRLIDWVNQDGINTRTQAFLVGALTHITETDDLHRQSVTHPGCIVVPAVLALGAKHQFNDRQMLEATIRGFEAMCRIGNAVGPQHYKIWHNTATCGPFGSAYAVADLLGLSAEQTVNALGNAGTQSSGLWQFLESGAMSKHLHAGRGSEAGVLAAELAALGFTGPADILEGEQGMFKAMCPDADPEKVLVDADNEWQLQLTSIKPWPSCRHTHPTIDAALEIHNLLGNSVVESVNVDTYQAALDICNRTETANEYQAKFSLQHCVSKALMDGEVTLNSFDEAARADSADMRLKVNVNAVDPYKTDYPVSWGASV